MVEFYGPVWPDHGRGRSVSCRCSGRIAADDFGLAKIFWRGAGQFKCGCAHDAPPLLCLLHSMLLSGAGAVGLWRCQGPISGVIAPGHQPRHQRMLSKRGPEDGHSRCRQVARGRLVETSSSNQGGQPHQNRSPQGAAGLED